MSSVHPISNKWTERREIRNRAQEQKEKEEREKTAGGLRTITTWKKDYERQVLFPSSATFAGNWIRIRAVRTGTAPKEWT